MNVIKRSWSGALSLIASAALVLALPLPAYAHHDELGDHAAVIVIAAVVGVAVVAMVASGRRRSNLAD
jgi:peptidoglycan/LPS O-acetylase OafA/YrhL